VVENPSYLVTNRDQRFPDYFHWWAAWTNKYSKSSIKIYIQYPAFWRDRKWYRDNPLPIRLFAKRC
jgi:hypothetical protein